MTDAVVVLVGVVVVGEALATGLIELGRVIRAAHRRLSQTGAIHMPRFRLAALALVAGLGVAAACSSEGDTPSSTDPTAEGPVTNSGNEENPPTADVALTTCDGGDFGTATAGLIVTNNSSEPSTYSITVEFVDASGVRYGEGYAGSSAVAPGQKVEVDAFGVEEIRPGTTCRVTQVERFAS